MTTNYERHFGGPLRVAETLSGAGICWGTLTGEITCGDSCEPCPMYEAGSDGEKCNDSVEKWLRWLESEALGAVCPFERHYEIDGRAYLYRPCEGCTSYDHLGCLYFRGIAPEHTEGGAD